MKILECYDRYFDEYAQGSYDRKGCYGQMYQRRRALLTFMGSHIGILHHCEPNTDTQCAIPTSATADQRSVLNLLLYRSCTGQRATDSSNATLCILVYVFSEF